MTTYVKPSWAGSAPSNAAGAPAVGVPAAPAHCASAAPTPVPATAGRTVPARPAPPPPPIDTRPIYDPAFLPTDPGGQPEQPFYGQQPWDWPPHVSNYHKARHVD